MNRDAGYLLVRAGARLVGLPIAQVVEVVEPGAVYAVPSVEPAVRGVVRIRGSILPLVHLGALLEGTACPAEEGGTGVVASLDRGAVCLEVEAADFVLRESGLPLPAGTSLPGAVAVARFADELVPLLDLSTLAGGLRCAGRSLEAKAV